MLYLQGQRQIFWVQRFRKSYLWNLGKFFCLLLEVKSHVPYFAEVDWIRWVILCNYHGQDVSCPAVLDCTSATCYSLLAMVNLVSSRSVNKIGQGPLRSGKIWAMSLPLVWPFACSCGITGFCSGWEGECSSAPWSFLMGARASERVVLPRYKRL